MSAVLNTPPAAAATYTAQEYKLAHARQVLRHYSQDQLVAIDKLYQVAKQHQGTSGGNAAAKLLLGLYNGKRFPFDLTDLRVLDAGNYAAAMVVIDMDARRTYTEVHVILAALHVGEPVQSVMEMWAVDLGLKGRATKAGIAEMRRELKS